jgi:uncharacterized membrane protein YedE/YeeE
LSCAYIDAMNIGRSRAMMLAAGILNSLGALSIVAGAWIQGSQQYSDYKRQIEAYKEGKPWRPPLIESAPGEKFPSSFRSVFWSVRKVTFASLYGWRLIVVGGALVLFGSVLATIAAPTSAS